jgi:hypothetical protein
LWFHLCHLEMRVRACPDRIIDCVGAQLVVPGFSYFNL